MLTSKKLPIAYLGPLGRQKITKEYEVEVLAHTEVHETIERVVSCYGTSLKSNYYTIRLTPQSKQHNVSLLCPSTFLPSSNIYLFGQQTAEDLLAWCNLSPLPVFNPLWERPHSHQFKTSQLRTNHPINRELYDAILLLEWLIPDVMYEQKVLATIKQNLLSNFSIKTNVQNVKGTNTIIGKLLFSNKNLTSSCIKKSRGRKLCRSNYPYIETFLESNNIPSYF